MKNLKKFLHFGKLSCLSRHLGFGCNCFCLSGGVSLCFSNLGKAKEPKEMGLDIAYVRVKD